MASELTVPQLDFSSLAKLPQVYQNAQTQAARRQTLADLGNGQGALDYNDAAKRLFAAGDAEMGLSLAKLGVTAQGAGGVFGTPIYGTRPDGSTAIGTFDKRGRFHEIATPNFNPTPGVKTIDAGTGTYIVNGRTGALVSGNSMQLGQPAQAGQPPQPTGYIPKDVQGEAQQKRLGTEVGERQADLGKAKSALDGGIAGLDALQLQANEVLHHPGLGRITGMTGMLPNVPGFPGADAQAKLDTLKAKVGFAALQAMRDASKTGGALGQVSDFENKNLQNSMVELQNAQSEKQIKAALQKLVVQIDGMRDRMRAAYQQDYANIPAPSFGGGQAQAPAGTAPQPPVTKSIGGKTYIKSGNQWFEQ